MCLSRRTLLLVFLIVVACPNFWLAAQPEQFIWLPRLVRENGNFGKVLSTADVNRDGITDLIAVTPFAGAFAVEANAILGSRGGLSGDTLIIGGSAQTQGEGFQAAVIFAEVEGSTATVLAAGSTVSRQAQDLPFFGGECIPGTTGHFGSTTGDFDGNGQLEVIVACSNSGHFWLWDDGSAPVTVSMNPFYTPSIDPEFADLGAALASGDYNGDGFDDLAIGIPGAIVDGFADNGIVQILFGAEDGLNFEADPDAQFASLLQAGARFSATLATGDFNGDGTDDLAVGVPFEDDQRIEAGATYVYHGSDPFDRVADLRIIQDKLEIEGATLNRPREHFGTALASGDFNGDHFDDLAIGVPGDSVLSPVGSANVLFGTKDGLTFEQAQLLSCVSDVLEYSCSDAVSVPWNWGYALTAGDFNADGIDDLAIGVPGAIFSPEGPFGNRLIGAGSVLTVYGTRSGLMANGPIIHLSTMQIGDNKPFFDTLEDVDTLIVPMVGRFGVLADHDAFSRRIELASFSQPTKGTATFVDTLIDDLGPNGVRGALLYSPPPDRAELRDSIHYVIKPLLADRLDAPIPDSAAGIFVIRINPVNDPPFFRTTNEDLDGRAFVGLPYDAHIFTDDIDTFELQVAVRQQPPWLGFAFVADQPGNRHLRIFGSPTIADIGTSNLELLVDDGEFEVVESFEITVELIPPAAPVTLLPVDGQEGVTLPLALQWRSSPTADEYHVQIATDPNFSVAVGSQTGPDEIILDSVGVNDTTLVVDDLVPAAAYFWRVRASNSAGAGPFSTAQSFSTNQVGTSAELDRPVPGAFALSNYPNPVAGETKIVFSIPEAAHARVRLFDLRGREIQTVLDRTVAAGLHEVDVSVAALPAGIYLYELDAGERTMTRSMVVTSKSR